jgi:hypothetical protein
MDVLNATLYSITDNSSLKLQSALKDGSQEGKLWGVRP